MYNRDALEKNHRVSLNGPPFSVISEKGGPLVFSQESPSITVTDISNLASYNAKLF
jgi:hypothetical protein